MLPAIDIVCRQITVTRTVLQDIAMPLLTSFIDGRYVPERADAERFETIDPATGEGLAEVQAATDADIDDAVASARQGQQAWAARVAISGFPFMPAASPDGMPGAGCRCGDTRCHGEADGDRSCSRREAEGGAWAAPALGHSGAGPEQDRRRDPLK